MRVGEWFSGVSNWLAVKVEAGWDITYRGIIVTSPLHLKSEHVVLCVLMILLETLFSIVFCPMRATTHGLT